MSIHDHFLIGYFILNHFWSAFSGFYLFLPNPHWSVYMLVPLFWELMFSLKPQSFFIYSNHFVHISIWCLTSSPLQHLYWVCFERVGNLYRHFVDCFFWFFFWHRRVRSNRVKRICCWYEGGALYLGSVFQRCVLGFIFQRCCLPLQATQFNWVGPCHYVVRK